MLSRTSDACSPALLGALMSGKHFRRLTLSQYDASSVLKATLPLTVRSKSQRGAAVRTPMRVSGRLARMALITSIEREACPNPWPEM